MRHISRAARLVWGDKNLRKFVWKPIWQALGVGLIWVALSFFTLRPLIQWLLEQTPIGREWVQAGSVLLWVVYWCFAFGPAFFTIAGMMSAFLWERLSLEVERKVHGPNVPNQSLGMVMGTVDGFKRAPRGIGISIVCALLSPLFFGVPSAALAGWQAVFDYTSPAFARRGVHWPSQKQWVPKLKDRQELMIASAVASFIPLVNLLFIPTLVAAGTLITAEEFPDEMESRSIPLLG